MSQFQENMGSNRLANFKNKGKDSEVIIFSIQYSGKYTKFISIVNFFLGNASKKVYSYS